MWSFLEFGVTWRGPCEHIGTSGTDLEACKTECNIDLWRVATFGDFMKYEEIFERKKNRKQWEK